MDPLSTFSQHLAPLISAVHTSEFPTRLVHLLKALVPIDDAPALADAIARVGDAGLAAKLRAAGTDAYRRDYTEQAVVDRYLDFFQAVHRRKAA